MSRVFTADDSTQFLANRKSIYPRQFTGNEISLELIYDLLAPARLAPTHKLTQPWRFAVFSGKGKESLFELQRKVFYDLIDDEAQRNIKIQKARLKLNQSAAVVAVNMKRDEGQRIPEWEEVAAVSCALQNVMLHMPSLGLGGYWSTGGSVNHSIYREYFELADNDRHLGWLYVGQADESSAVEKCRLDVNEYLRVIAH